MNTAQTMDEQMPMRSLHTGGVTGSIPVAPTTQTIENTSVASPDEGVNAGSAEPSATLTDRYGAGVEKTDAPSPSRDTPGREWRAIASAPKDETWVLFYPHHMVGFWDLGGKFWRLVLTIPLNDDMTISDKHGGIFYEVAASSFGMPEPTHWLSLDDLPPTPPQETGHE